MRKIIAWEGEEKVPGQFLEVGSFKWGNEPIVVTKNTEWDADSVIGEATDLRREDNGSVTAEIKLQEGFTILLDDLSFTVYCNDLKSIGSRGFPPSRLSSARIRAIFADTSVPW